MTRKEAIKPEDIQVTYSKSKRYTDKSILEDNQQPKRNHTMWEDQK